MKKLTYHLLLEFLYQNCPFVKILPQTWYEKRGLTSSLFIGSSLPIRSQAGSPAPGQNPNSGQRSRNSSGTGSINKGSFLSFFVSWKIETKRSILSITYVIFSCPLKKTFLYFDILLGSKMKNWKKIHVVGELP